MRVSRYNYAAQFPGGLETLIGDLGRMIVEGRYVLSPEVAAFEKAYAEFHGVAFAKGVNTGTDALAVTFMALGLGPGDEVITQANTFNATVAAILMAGARPVLVDADPETFLIDSTQIAAALTPRTRALVPVHMYGKPTPMEPILQIADAGGLFVVEDAAQSHGAGFAGRRTGTFGIAGCFSFHPSKNLAAAGDGGAIITRDRALADAIEEIRSLGQRGQNHHVRVGFNSKLDSIQARILSAKLSYLDAWNESRRRVAASYRERLAGLPIRFQAHSAGEEHVYHLFQIRTSRRGELLEHLVASGVDAVVRYPQPIHRQPAFAQFSWRAGQFPVAEALSAELLCLPIRPDLSEAEMDYVCGQIRVFFSR